MSAVTKHTLWAAIAATGSVINFANAFDGAWWENGIYRGAGFVCAWYAFHRLVRAVSAGSGEGTG